MPVESARNDEENRKNQIHQQTDFRIDKGEEHCQAVRHICEHQSLAHAPDYHRIDVFIHETSPVSREQPAHVQTKCRQEDITPVPHHRQQMEPELSENGRRKRNDRDRQKKEKIDPEVSSVRTTNEQTLNMMADPINTGEHVS